jgi:hypothetical protein
MPHFLRPSLRTGNIKASEQVFVELNGRRVEPTGEA